VKRLRFFSGSPRALVRLIERRWKLFLQVADRSSWIGFEQARPGAFRGEFVPGVSQWAGFER
jgi:hypothetical protein